MALLFLNALVNILNTFIDSTIASLLYDTLIVVERSGVHVPRTVKMKACLYTGGNF